MNVVNLEKSAFDNIDKRVCENTDTVKPREYDTILEHALDSKNHDFLGGAIFVKDENGKNICDLYIDFTRVEVVDGEEDGLLDFFDKVINDVGSSAVHSLDTVKNIKIKLERCVDLYKERQASK